MTVAVVIVSYQVRDLLRRCLASVRAQAGVACECRVVDNASTDGSAEMVAREFPEVHLRRNPGNVGFARANNIALAEATADILLLLNPDTELPAGALAELARAFGRHPGAGAVGLGLVGADGRPQPACHAFPGVLNQLLEGAGLQRPGLALGLGTPSEAPVPRGGEGVVDWVAGACLAMSRAAYARVGGLDPDRFMYGEEMDWCWRARAAGFRTVHCGSVRVLHHGGASSVGMAGPLYVQNLEARLLFLRRHRGAWRADLTRLILLAGSAGRLAAWSLAAALEGAARRPRTREQLERFRTGTAWLLRGAR